MGGFSGYYLMVEPPHDTTSVIFGEPGVHGNWSKNIDQLHEVLGARVLFPSTEHHTERQRFQKKSEHDA
jgi:hypothetical protein